MGFIYFRPASGPASLPPSGSAGGVLTGTFPNPGLADNVVTNAKIVDGTIGSAELATDSVTSVKIAADAVGSSEIAAGAVGTSELADDSVTFAKLAPLTYDDASGTLSLGVGATSTVLTMSAPVTGVYDLSVWGSFLAGSSGGVYFVDIVVNGVIFASNHNPPGASALIGRDDVAAACTVLIPAGQSIQLKLSRSGGSATINVNYFASIALVGA